MSKSGLIFPLCFLLVSGCALSENPEMAPPKSEVTSAVTERQSAPPPPATELTTQLSEQTLTNRTYTPEEIRRLQSALKDLGFDPGPADGVAGNKTKTALERLQAGCVQVKPLTENPSNAESSTSAKTYTRGEVLKMQAELRRAGFNIGSPDGIFGNRTRTVMIHLRSLCPAMPEYASLLASPTEVAKPKTAGLSPARTAGAAAAPVRVEAVKTFQASPPAGTQEEIRILQLRLRDAGFDPGGFDGVMGPKTEKALQDFQAAQRAGKTKASVTTGTSSFY